MTTQPDVLDTQGQATRRVPYKYERHDELLDTPVGGGERDQWTIGAVLDLFPTLPNWPTQDAEGYKRRARRTEGGRTVLEWLRSHPGNGWQERWVLSGADSGMEWVADLVAADARIARTARNELMSGLASVLLCRIVFPSYTFLAAYRSAGLFTYARQVFRADLFAKLEARGAELDVPSHTVQQALMLTAKIVLRTGRDIDQLDGDDLLAFRAAHLRHRHASPSGGGIPGLTAAWTLLHDLVGLGEHATITEAVRRGQRPTKELVDAYGIRSRLVRDVLVRYLEERHPGLDYNTFTNIVSVLARDFWADIERQHPGIDTLDLPSDVAQAWKHRLRTVVERDGHRRPRKNYEDALVLVRAFYRDLQEWALNDPSWAQWSVPSPVRKGDTVGMGKAKKKRTAAMHQRVRERLPHLPVLIDVAERGKADRAAFLATATATPIAQTFEHGGCEYRRTAPKVYKQAHYRDRTPPVQAENLTTGKVVDVGKSEHDAFWSWAVIEVLRHTGVRVEELLEITQLGLISYQLPDTGEVVPMLQIVPSKGNEERLLLVGPELASVLATIITRLRRETGAQSP